MNQASKEARRAFILKIIKNLTPRKKKKRIRWSENKMFHKNKRIKINKENYNVRVLIIKWNTYLFSVI